MEKQNNVILISLTTPKAITSKDVEGKRVNDFICELLKNNEADLQDGDVLIITSKIVSFFEGYLIKLKFRY